jgi:hypothetical protein
MEYKFNLFQKKKKKKKVQHPHFKSTISFSPFLKYPSKGPCTPEIV